MKTSPILTCAALALLAATPNAVADQIADLTALARQVADLQQPAKKSGRGRSSSSANPTPGLRMSTLNPAAPQASSGLGTTARGLTPSDEWRRSFPASKK